MTQHDEDRASVDPAVRYDLDHGTAVITIDRPSARNALTAEVLLGIANALDRAESDPGVRVIVLTGGPEIFASGADIRELRKTTPADYLLSERLTAWQRFARTAKPTIAAVSGYVLGGGAELALSCDLIVAADTARFGQPEINLGILPGAGGTQRWARVAGRFRAAELVIAGDMIDAWTAHRWGLVTSVVPARRVVDAAVDLAGRIAAKSPIATRLAKSAVRASEEMALSAAMAHERAQLTTLLSTDDHLEGIDAFLEKRPATFTGR